MWNTTQYVKRKSSKRYIHSIEEPNSISENKRYNNSKKNFNESLTDRQHQAEERFLGLKDKVGKLLYSDTNAEKV